MAEYTDRISRQKYIAEKFANYLNGSVLNIGGGGDKTLLKYCQPKEYTELDISGEPDLVINLDKEYPLPIEDNRFDMVICTEVLEHLEEFHRVFEELLRIASKYIIISLPNASTTIRSYIRRSKYQGVAGEAGIDVGFHSKFYGLPLNIPSDRHRWFFSFTEAEYFFHNKINKYGYKIISEFGTGHNTISIKSWLLGKFVKLLFGEPVFNDWFSGNYWVLLKVKQ